MVKVVSLGQLSQLSAGQVNTALTKIEQAFANTLSRDGSTPNNMSADLDMNSNDIINVDTVEAQTINVNSAIIGGKSFAGSLEYRSDWTEDTAYRYLDLVKHLGSVYVCLLDHTSDVFNNEVSELKWELFLEPGSGSGSEGPEGPQGPAGPTGATGATGPQGEPGSSGSSLSGEVTVTVPNNRREHQETVTATGVTGANRISIWLAPGLDSDENISDMIDLVTLSAIPLTDQITVLASFSQPQAGPIKLQWSAF